MLNRGRKSAKMAVKTARGNGCHAVAAGSYVRKFFTEPE